MRRLVLLLPLALVALIAAGCGDGDASGNDSASGSDAAITKTEGEVNDEQKIASEEAMKDGESMKDGEAMQDGEAMKDGDAMKDGEAMKEESTQVKVVDSDFGSVIADSEGQAFYLFGKEDAGQSECYGACAEAWPPVLTKGEPQAGSGAEQSLLGTTERSDGKLQVTYAGQPLYYFAGDSPGTILCNDVEEFGGLWLVVKPNGEAAS